MTEGQNEELPQKVKKAKKEIRGGLNKPRKHRIKNLVFFLNEKAKRWKEIEKEFDVSNATISRDLQLLEKAGVVRKRDDKYKARLTRDLFNLEDLKRKAKTRLNFIDSCIDQGIFESEVDKYDIIRGLDSWQPDIDIEKVKKGKAPFDLTLLKQFIDTIFMKTGPGSGPFPIEEIRIKFSSQASRRIHGLRKEKKKIIEEVVTIQHTEEDE